MKWICKCGSTLGYEATPSKYNFAVLSDVQKDWMVRGPSAEEEPYVTLLGRPGLLGFDMCHTCHRLWFFLGKGLVSFSPESSFASELIPTPDDVAECNGTALAYGRRLSFTGG